MRNPDLWARLEAHRFDAPGSAPFSVKLARAERWDRAFTARVIEEYRRFLYLTQIGDAQVTPSRAVDAAWHMHLTFTRDYWEVLCPDVIGAKIHHQPCASDEEMPRYRDQFAATRALYEAEFGAAPPGDIWGAGRPAPVMQMASDEAGGLQITPDLLMWIAVAGCLGLYLFGPALHWLVYTGIVVVVLALGRILERASGKRRRRRRQGDDDDGWLTYEFSRGRRDRGDGDDRTDRDAGDGDGGGCGGCGD